eukprot:1508899-Rhodomonas_salina.2
MQVRHCAHPERGSLALMSQCAVSLSHNQSADLSRMHVQGSSVLIVWCDVQIMRGTTRHKRQPGSAAGAKSHDPLKAAQG